MIDDNVDGTLQGAFRGTDPDEAAVVLAACRANFAGDDLADMLSMLGIEAA